MLLKWQKIKIEADLLTFVISMRQYDPNDGVSDICSQIPQQKKNDKSILGSCWRSFTENREKSMSYRNIRAENVAIRLLSVTFDPSYFQMPCLSHVEMIQSGGPSAKIFIKH